VPEAFFSKEQEVELTRIVYKFESYAKKDWRWVTSRTLELFELVTPTPGLLCSRTYKLFESQSNPVVFPVKDRTSPVRDQQEVFHKTFFLRALLTFFAP
jgi:hypothetical protein